MSVRRRPTGMLFGSRAVTVAAAAVLAAALALTGCSGGQPRPAGSAGPSGNPSAASSAPAPASTPGAGTPAPPAGTPSAPGGSGIDGVTVAAGRCPVVVTETSCPNRPTAAEFVVVDSATGALVTTVRSDADGRFRAALAPGGYALRNIGVGAAYRSPPLSVIVKPGRYTTVTMLVTNGVR